MYCNNEDSHLLWVFRCTRYVTIVVRRSGSYVQKSEIQKSRQKLTVLSSVGRKAELDVPLIIDILTLQEASILCIVMHIAITVKTGDQPSLPNMEAQIYVNELSNP